MFQANDDHTTIKDIVFPVPIITRYLRIYPKTWSYWCLLRMEVIGCRLRNECIQDIPCHENADCHDLDDGYQCVCKTGYTGNGYQCQGMTDVETSIMGLQLSKQST